jgi:hypothetical protein
MTTTTSKGSTMSTQEKADRIAAYFAYHRANGLTVDESIDHIASGLKIERDTVLVAIHYALTH